MFRTIIYSYKFSLVIYNKAF
ncbi:protein of unknown function [Xenorhabdus poinarii G6]|uniref:Uncharacterized protein n=1 Tax=Xenorhabdus poinarii G6 TaxID=1354304 RepID=A0A068QXX7_9GAMM|nr:protein of unknown function [Xenorhabdus poinarii G6]